MLKRLINRIGLGLVRRSHTAYKLLSVAATVKTGDAALRIPITNGIGLKNLHFASEEPWVARVIPCLNAQRPGSFIDVGANTGNFLLALSACVPEMPYTGFEPSVVSCAYIQSLIAANRFPAAAVFPVALGDENGVVSIYYNSDTDVSATIAPGSRGDWTFNQMRQVLVFKGDDIFAKLCLDNISIIKIDVEGFEGAVLRGMSETLAAQQPAVIFEVLPYAHMDAAYFERHGGRSSLQEQDRVRSIRREHAGYLTQFFREREFRFGLIDQNSGKVTWKQSLDPGISRDRRTVNHLAVHASQTKIIRAIDQL